MEWITDPQMWIALATLTALEIVLGVDNIIFISILVGRLPEHQRNRARVIGLGLAMGTRILLLLSLAWIIFETSYPHHAELGKVQGTHVFRNVRRFKGLETAEGVLIFRFDAPLFFANIDRFCEVLAEYRNRRKDMIHTIIIDMESIHSIDSSALDIFAELVEETGRENIRIVLAEVKGPVRDKFHKSGLTEKLGEKLFFVTVDDAYKAIQGQQNEDTPGIALQTNALGGQ